MLQINDPCPISLNQLQKIGENCYFCKGCNEKVIDFTQASDAEIKAQNGQKICGIFRDEQLDLKPVFHWRKAILYRLMACASFLGFAVSPIHADELVSTGKNQQEISTLKDKKKLNKPKKKRKKKIRRGRTVGAYAYGMDESSELKL
ncbi:hypothetical protein [Fluviicola sp.]|uniref:hypothetical protein n=1 Tax=Fluviicola sp. TaxID=1917219 RepID=UPI003D2E4E3D